MDQVDDLGHCGFLAALSARRVRKLNRLPISQQPPRQEQVVDVCRRRLQVIRLHRGGGGC